MPGFPAAPGRLAPDTGQVPSFSSLEEPAAGPDEFPGSAGVCSGSLSLFVMLLSFLAYCCVSAKWSVSVARGLLAADAFVTRLSAGFRVGPGGGGGRPERCPEGCPERRNHAPPPPLGPWRCVWHRLQFFLGSGSHFSWGDPSRASGPWDPASCLCPSSEGVAVAPCCD